MLRIDVWSDYVCPFCWLEAPLLDALAERLQERVDIHWRAFELRPDPVPTLDPDGDYLHDIWGRAVYPMAAERGMRIALPPVQPRSRLALEAAVFARGEGRFDAMHRAIFRAFFEDGMDIGRPDVLVGLARQAGVPADALAAALQGGTHTAEVLADQELARRLGVRGVPMMVFRPDDRSWEGATGLSGAQPLERMLAVAQRVMDASPPAP